MVSGMAVAEEEEPLHGSQKAGMLPPAAHLTSSCLVIFLSKILSPSALELGNEEDNFLRLK